MRTAIIKYELSGETEEAYQDVCSELLFEDIINNQLGWIDVTATLESDSGPLPNGEIVPVVDIKFGPLEGQE